MAHSSHTKSSVSIDLFNLATAARCEETFDNDMRDT